MVIPHMVKYPSSKEIDNSKVCISVAEGRASDVVTETVVNRKRTCIPHRELSAIQVAFSTLCELHNLHLPCAQQWLG